MSGRRGLAVVAAACAAVLLTGSPALGAGVSTAELQRLAVTAAAGNPQALAQLRAVTSVDGRPSTLQALLRDGTGAQIHARLVVIARGTTTSPRPAADSSAIAASVLREPRFGRATNPDPLLTALRAVGRWLNKLASITPGGPAIFWIVAGALVLALVAFGVRRSLARMHAIAASESGETSAAEDPEALEREAQAAEAAGAFAEAVRLRFRGGLLALGARSAIDYRPSLLTTDVARRLSSPQFDSLTATFERITYGGAAAAPDDAADSRSGWAELLATAGHR
jgi:hypothetical protein